MTISQLCALAAGLVVLATAIVALLNSRYQFLTSKKKYNEITEVTAPSSSSKPRVLMVDDNREVISALRLSLNGDYEIRAFEFPHDALHKIIDCHERHTPFDAALIDYNLGHVKGVQVVKVLRLFSPKTKIAFISGGAMLIEHRESALVDAIWRKPQDTYSEALRRNLESLLGRKAQTKPD